MKSVMIRVGLDVAVEYTKSACLCLSRDRGELQVGRGAVRLYRGFRAYLCCVIVPSLLFGSDPVRMFPIFSENSYSIRCSTDWRVHGIAGRNILFIFLPMIPFCPSKRHSDTRTDGIFLSPPRSRLLFMVVIGPYHRIRTRTTSYTR